MTETLIGVVGWIVQNTPLLEGTAITYIEGHLIIWDDLPGYWEAKLQ